MSAQFKRDSRGLAAILRSREVAKVIDAKAEEVAGYARREGRRVNHGREDLPVRVESYTTDRAAASVTLAHAAGRAMQIKHGVLTRAASAAGLQVKATKE